MNKRSMILLIIKNIIIWKISMITITPVLLILINSFKDRVQAAPMSMRLPKTFHFENYLTVIERGNLYRSFYNSMLYTCMAILIAVVLTSMAAYVLSRNKTKLNRFLYFFIILGLAMPVNYVS